MATTLNPPAPRVLGRTDTTQSMVVWMLAMLSAFALALAWREWVPVDAAHWKPIAVLALAGAIGQWGITEAFRRTLIRTTTGFRCWPTGSTSCCRPTIRSLIRPTFRSPTWRVRSSSLQRRAPRVPR